MATTGRTRFRITNRLFALLGGSFLLFAVGTNVQAGWVLAIAALLFGLMIVGIVLPFSALKGIEVDRIPPPTATEQSPVAVDLAVRNASARTRALVRVSDDFLGGGTAAIGLIAPGQRRLFRTQRDCGRRGIYLDGECDLVSGAPFGVVRATKRITVSSPVTIVPRLYDADVARFLGAGAVPTAAAVGDVSSVRDYRPGDPLRHVHWRSVARHGRMMVREFDDHRDADIVLGAEVTDDADIADVVARIACSLAVPLLRDGEVGLVSAGADRDLRAREPDTVLRWGAGLQPGVVDGDRLDTDARAVVIVCDATSPLARAATSVASRRPMTAVLVGADDDAARALRGAGARVALVGQGEVETWFAQGCATD